MAASSISSSSSKSGIFTVLAVEPGQGNMFFQTDSFKQLESDATSLHNVVLIEDLIQAIKDWLDQDPKSVDPILNHLLMKHFNDLPLPQHLKNYFEEFEQDAVGRFKAQPILDWRHFHDDLKEALRQLQRKLEQQCEIKKSEVGEGLKLLFGIDRFKTVENIRVQKILGLFSKVGVTLNHLQKELRACFFQKEEFDDFLIKIKKLQEDLAAQGKLSKIELDKSKRAEQSMYPFIGFIIRTQKKPKTRLVECLSNYKNDPKIFENKILTLRDISNSIFFESIIKNAEKNYDEFKFHLNNKRIVRITVIENGDELSICRISTEIFKETSFYQLVTSFSKREEKICHVEFPPGPYCGRDSEYEMEMHTTEHLPGGQVNQVIGYFLNERTIWAKKIRDLREKETCSLTEIKLKGIEHGEVHLLVHQRIRSGKKYEDHYYYKSDLKTKQTEGSLDASQFAQFKIVESISYQAKDKTSNLISLEDKSSDKSLFFQNAENNIKELETEIICDLLASNFPIAQWVSGFLGITENFKIDPQSKTARSLEEICKIRKDIFEKIVEPLQIFRNIVFDAYYIKICNFFKESQCKESRFLHGSYVESLQALNRMRLLKQAVDYLHGIAGKQGIFFIGYTGAGKSTAGGFLTGADVKMDELGRAVYEKNGADLPVIGHGSSLSQTIFAQGYLNEESDFAVIDCPGFLDLRGRDYQLCTSVSLDRAFNSVTAVQACVIVVAYQSIIADRSSHFLSLIDLIGRRFDAMFESDLEAFPDNVFLLITKCQGLQDSDIKTLERMLNGSYFADQCRETKIPADQEYVEGLNEKNRQNRIWSHLAKMGHDEKIHPLIFEKKNPDSNNPDPIEEKMLGRYELLDVYQAPANRPIDGLSRCTMDISDRKRLQEGVAPFEIDWDSFCAYQKRGEKIIADNSASKEELEKKLSDHTKERTKILSDDSKLPSSTQTDEHSKARDDAKSWDPFGLYREGTVLSAEIKELNKSLSQMKEPTKILSDDPKLPSTNQTDEISKARDDARIQKEKDLICEWEKKIENNRQYINKTSSGYHIQKLGGNSDGGVTIGISSKIFMWFQKTIFRREAVEIGCECDLKILDNYSSYLEELSSKNTDSDKRINPTEVLKEQISANTAFKKEDPNSNPNKNKISFIYEFPAGGFLRIEGRDFELKDYRLNSSNTLLLNFKINLNSTHKIELNLYIPKIRYNKRWIVFREAENDKILEKIKRSNTTIKAIEDLAKEITNNQEEITRLTKEIEDCKSEKTLLDEFIKEYEPLALTLKQLQTFYPEIKLKENLQSPEYESSSFKELTESESSSSQGQSESSDKGKEEEI